jgi:phosphoadenosine phosphosulfate reductase
MRELGELSAFSVELEGLTTGQRLRWVWENLSPRVSFGTAFGPTGLVLLDIAQKETPELSVFTIDTGYIFEETCELRDKIELRYGIDIEVLVPENTVEDQARIHGKDLYSKDPDLCCAIRKVAPLRKKLSHLDGWVTSIRRDQSESRKDTRIVDGYWFDSGHQVVKVNPMADWTKKQVWDYILEHDIPYNPLLDQGYPSIGCWPCTQAVGEDAGERDGRWAGMAKTECGIHTPLLTLEQPESLSLAEDNA